MTIATLLFALIAAPATGATGGPVLLDFHADWCGPCRQMRPAIEQLIKGGYPVKSVDLDESPELAARYKVTAVPTFIVVDGDGQALARSSGAQPAGQLAQMYREARSKLKPTAAEPVVEAEAEDEGRDRGDSAPPRADGDEPAAENERPSPVSATVNPKPWETVVRIKVQGQGSIGYGSGTIIRSTPEESIILTCAHIFKLEGRKQASPAAFPRRIAVDLFDGKLSGQQPPMVHFAEETFEGKAIDYDFARDVGLIRIKPGRRLPYSRVVPAHWKPQERMLMTAVGCAEGRDATAWSTKILNPTMRGLSGNPQYEAIECDWAPKQGRSGGGLYTTDGYVAGVCDFAEPRGNHGLYATPSSIHHILDKNALSICYAPVRNPSGSGNGAGQTLADNRTSPRRSKATTPAITRAQSPDRDESNLVTIPPPELLGITTPAGELPTRRASSTGGARQSWHAPPNEAPKLARRRTEVDAESTEITLGPEFDNDFFTSPNAPTPETADGGGKDAKARTQAPTARPAKSSNPWRPVINANQGQPARTARP